MTDIQQRFVEEYTVDFNGAAAARRAGYSEHTAKEQACMLLKTEEIATAISERKKELTMSADEAAKHISDIARTRVNDYMVVNRVLKTPTVRKYLQQLIDDLDAETEFEEEFSRIAKLSGDDLTHHKVEQKRREIQGIRYTLELERKPDAYRDVAGESVWVEEASVDLVALAKAKEKGRIKIISYNEHGPKVELYPADAALNKILEYHGKINPAGSVNFSVIITPEDVKTFRDAFNQKY